MACGREGKSVGGGYLVERLSRLNRAQETALSGAAVGRMCLRRKCGEGTAGFMCKGHTTLS